MNEEVIVMEHFLSFRLSVIDESSFLSHSDISYDRTDDDVVRT